MIKEFIIRSWLFRFYLFLVRHFTTRKRAIDELLWTMKLHQRIKSSASTSNLILTSGGWAVGPSGLCMVFDAIKLVSEPKVLEFGLGESTKLISRLNTHKHTIIEHNLEWIELWTQSLIQPLDSKKTEIRNFPIVASPKLSQYNLSPDDLALDYNIFIVDGPFGSKGFSRRNILDIIPAWKPDKEFVIIMDDIHRIGELQTYVAIKKRLSKKKISFTSKIFSDQKQVGIICSAHFWSLISI